MSDASYWEDAAARYKEEISDLKAALAQKEKELAEAHEIRQKYEDRYFDSKKLSDLRLDDIKEMQRELDAKDATIVALREALTVIAYHGCGCANKDHDGYCSSRTALAALRAKEK